MRNYKIAKVVKTSRKNARRGVLTFEWILIFALLVIGVVGGLAAVRDALNISYGSVAGAALGLDASYAVKPFPPVDDQGDPVIDPGFTAPGMIFVDNNSELDGTWGIKSKAADDDSRNKVAVSPAKNLPTAVAYPK